MNHLAHLKKKDNRTAEEKNIQCLEGVLDASWYYTKSRYKVHKTEANES